MILLYFIERPLKFAKSAQFIISTDYIPSSVPAMCVDEVEVLTIAHEADMSPCPTRFT